MSKQPEGQGSLLATQDREASGPVECLGLTFENDEARRSYFLAELRKKLAAPEFRKTEGFPIGSDEDILALSDPPYYTACPNPFITDYIRHFGKAYDATVPYACEPFAADVSEGRTDQIYTAHSYHTKVPHKAIMRYLLHYTEPGDVVLDGFCGTGMTGVAAQMCGDAGTVASLGYRISADGTVLDENGEVVGKLGTRRAILIDVSPAASFVAANYNLPVNIPAFQDAANELLLRFSDQYGWMYETKDEKSGKKGRINFTVWSDVFLCSDCQGEIVFWDVAVEEGNVKDTAYCPHCRAEVTKTNLTRATTTVMDATIGKPVPKARQVPVLINYSVGGMKREKPPDAVDLKVLERIQREPVAGWYPTRRIDGDIDLWYERDYRALGIYSVDAFFTRRNLIMTTWFHREIEKLAHRDPRLRSFLWFWFESVLMGFSKLNRYREKGFSQVNQLLSGTLYVGAIQAEISPWYALVGKISRLSVFGRIQNPGAAISTESTAAADLPDSSVDYIFVDPPFGSNIIYSDLSFLWESWLRLYTNTDAEAVVHRRKRNNSFTLEDYTNMMVRCFKRMYRALKPGRWLTVEFHNSQNRVWTAIQEAMTQAGFVIADVRTLDKQMQTFKQVTAAGAVKQDLVISAYKPNGGLEKRFGLEAGSEDGVWDFVRTHLRQLPVFVSNGGTVEIIGERQNYILFDRMVAFHVERGVTVPISAAEFYQGLVQRFPERDGMYFLAEQVAEYDQKRMKAREVRQLEIFVRNEKSAIQWLRQQLQDKPQTFQELHPQFMREIGGWEKHEEPIELRELLDWNFGYYDGHSEVPSQIHRYLSTNYHDLRKLSKDAPALRAKAKGRYYVLDPTKEADVQKSREKALLREFLAYQDSKQKKLKVFRLEVIRAGFRSAWQQNDYKAILDVAAKIPEDVLQEDPMLLMWHTNSQMRAGRSS